MPGGGTSATPGDGTTTSTAGGGSQRGASTATTSTQTVATAPLGAAIPHAPPSDLVLTMLPGVLVDRATHTVYLMRDTNQVEAVDITTGKTRWIGKHAERPLQLSGTHLLAQAGTTLVVLDARTGKLEKKCTAAKGTTWTPSPLEPRLGTQALLSASLTSPDKVLLTWSINTYYAGGAKPTEEVERNARTHSEGMLDLDLKGCTFTARSSGTNPRLPPDQGLPRAETRHGNSVTNTEVLAASIVDGTDVRMILESTNGQSRLLLHRTPPPSADTAPPATTPAAAPAAPPDVELATGPAPYVHGWLSFDGRHSVAVVQDRTSGANGVFQYDHTIHDALTGQKVGAFRVTWHAGGVLIVGDAMFEITSTAVRGVDLKTGKDRWTRALRSLSYKGEMPP